MIGRPHIALAALVVIASIASAAAQDNAAARVLASNYQLADATGERKCAIVLDAKPSPPGFTLSFDRSACTALFSHLADVTAWQPAPARGINFVTAKGVVVTEFTEGVGGVYEGIRENDGVYFLSNLRIVDASEIQPADLVGEWNLSRPGGSTICRITLTNEAKPEQRFAIRIAPGCDSAITAFGPTMWQLNNGDILLFSESGDLIRLGKNEEGQWARLPDQKQARPRPLLMSR